MGKLDGKIALITGGSEGIGFATAKQFLIEGAAHVFITGRRQDVLDKAVKDLDNKNITAIRSDTSIMADLDELYSIIQKEQGHLDILFANVGIFFPASIEDMTEEHYDNIFNVNVKGTVFAVKKALPILVNGGSIILNGSGCALKAYASHSVYSATKAALRSFARNWAVDLKERQIRVNILVPGPIHTPALQRLGKNEEDRNQIHASLALATILNRIGTADEIAKAVVFLASDDSSYITGIELIVDGGFAQI